MFSRKLTWPIAVGAAAIAVGGGAYGIVSATASNSSAAASTASTTTVGSNPRIGPAGGGASNARSGPAAGGTVGTVASVSKSSFTVSTSATQKVTIARTSSTKYKKGTRTVSASAITTGKAVLVLGTTNGTTITATQVIVQPTASGSVTSSAVVPFQQGAPSTSKQVGQIPASYTQGSGTIVSGTTANKATEAALASYPGGIVDRVVKLSNGEYEVHNIGVNWPHHIFVNQNFKVVGAN
jgi:membrane-bound inhibitor of C-type lysozyme